MRNLEFSKGGKEFQICYLLTSSALRAPPPEEDRAAALITIDKKLLVCVTDDGLIAGIGVVFVILFTKFE